MSSDVPIADLEHLAKKAEDALGFRPCVPQLLSAYYQVQGKTVFTIARTGFGKTLTFWLPLLERSNGILVIVTPLNILGEKNAQEAMRRLHVQSISLNAQNVTKAVFKEIAELKYRVIVASPELLVLNEDFRKLLQTKKFTSHLINITFDEAHCIILWSGKDFRPEYKDTHKLRYFITDSDISFHFVSATLPPNVEAEIKHIFNLKEHNVKEIRLSNDRSNIHLQVAKMEHSKAGKRDLLRVLKLDGPDLPPKFMVFCNKRKETEDIARKLWEELEPDKKVKVPWFHSGMSDSFREKRMDMLKEGEIWGIICTDAAGMGLDVPDIVLAVQWGYVNSLCTLVQRLGRAGRDPTVEARGVYFVETDYFDTTRAEKRARAEKRKRNREKKQEVAVKRQRVAIAVEQPGKGPIPQSPQLGSMSKGSNNVEDEGRGEENASSSDSDTESDVNIAASRPRDVTLSRVLPSRKSTENFEEAAMDALINAQSRGYCLRRPLDEYFENHRAKKYACPCGGRCVALASRLCCDVCSPDDAAFSFFPVPPTPTRKRGKNKVKINDFEMSDLDYSLRDELNDWRTRKAAETGYHDGFFGSQIIMPNVVRDRIVALFHSGKVEYNVDGFSEQVKWNDAPIYSEEILALISKLKPPPSPVPLTPAPPLTSPFVSTPLPSRRVLGNVASPITPTPSLMVPDMTTLPQPKVSRSRGPYGCSVCKAKGLSPLGHTARSRNCPFSKKENLDPSQSQ